MKRILTLRILVGGLLIVTASVTSHAWATTPEEALQLLPIQKNVDYDRPSREEVAGCTIATREFGSHVGLVVSDSRGNILRRFLDTNKDGVVDQWSYYKDGLEIYRDIDSNFNGKSDQHRWFHTAGSRWGLNRDEDEAGTIDTWKTISAAEVTAEVIGALANRDAQRFARVTLSSQELRSLGLGSGKAAELEKKIAQLAAGFQQAMAQQKIVGLSTEWVQFSGTHPGVVPIGTDDSTKDLRVYENAMAIVKTGEEHGQVLIGTLVEVGSTWRVIDIPQPMSSGGSPLAATGFFFRGDQVDPSSLAATGPSEQTQSLLTELEKLDAATEQTTSPQQLAQYNTRRADLIERIAQSSQPEDRVMWLRQLADMVTAAVQSGGYPEGAKRLAQLSEKLAKDPKDQPLVAYVKFRQLTAEYGLAMQSASTSEFVKIQEAWLTKLEQYANDYPTSPDAAEAILRLGMAQEYAGEEEQAEKWYAQVVKAFPNAPQALKAAGARTRLDSVGKTIVLRGQGPTGQPVDIASYRGKVVLVQYWATWCKPCKTDMAALKELWTKYGNAGFNVLGVNFDSDSREMTSYVAEHRLPWPQIHEEGGLENRLANELGIIALPTMLLVDQQGKVVNRNVHVAELDVELKKLIR